MKYWIMVILEESCICGTCGCGIELGKLAFVLVDIVRRTTGIPSLGDSNWLNCLDCMKEKFPEAVSGL